MRFKKALSTAFWLIFLLAASTVALAEGNPIKWMQGGKEVYLVRKADNFLVLYDRSESMAEKYNGTIMTKLQAERKILLEKYATLPDMDWQAGVYSFTPGSDFRNGFTSLVEHYPTRLYETKWFSWKLMKMPLKPEGPTMLQPGLMALDKVLDPMEGKTVVFLFTDGQYSAVEHVQSPGAIAKNLAKEHDLCFVVMDTGADKPEEKLTVNALANTTPCSYKVPFDQLLGNPEWMTNALFEVVEKKPKGDVVVGYVWDNILFDFDKYNVKPQYKQSLAAAGAYLRKYPQARIVLEGHTDSIGTRDYNMKLSHNRAAAVRNYLVKKEGIDIKRITLSGFGYNRPVASNKTSSGRAMNRRVQGIITGIK